jgi:GMP synthase-like glutamine amidotransferase
MSDPRPVIGVLELGLPPAVLSADYPGYAQMIIDWLQPALPEAEYRVIATVRSGAMPSLEELDGLVYSGSRHGVYDEVEWIAPLEALIRMARVLGKPQFGICFGHQILAQALGGRVQKAARGWSCGVQEYRLATPIDGRDHLRALVMHQDQVLECPPGARVLGGSSTCPIGILEHAPGISSVQFHPEFSADFVCDLLDAYGGNLIPAAVAERARETLSIGLDSSRVASWAATFFRSHLASKRMVGN